MLLCLRGRVKNVEHRPALPSDRLSLLDVLVELQTWLKRLYTLIDQVEHARVRNVSRVENGEMVLGSMQRVEFRKDVGLILFVHLKLDSSRVKRVVENNVNAFLPLV